jgi:antitoxin component YwqK of YwqJK toxin-antitoxin module
MVESNDFSGYINEVNDPFAKDENVTEYLNLPLRMNLKSNGSSNGLIKEYYDDGSVKEEVFFVNGVKEGSHEIWYANGQISKSGSMKSDCWHGKYQEWYENGSLKLSGHYMDGQQEGQWVFFDKEGNSLPNLNFENGTETPRKLPKLLGN